jgi:hypothetical protein
MISGGTCVGKKSLVDRRDLIKFDISADFKLSSIKQAYFRNSLNGRCGNQILNWYEKQKILVWAYS